MCITVATELQYKFRLSESRIFVFFIRIQFMNSYTFKLKF